MIPHELLTRTVRAVDAWSGEERRWVSCARIVDAVAGARVGDLETSLRLCPWWLDPATLPLVALVDLIRRGLVEGRGDFGSGFDPPAAPGCSECRRVDRPATSVLTDVAGIADPGATVMAFDPRRWLLDRGLGPVRLGEPLPATLDAPWTVVDESGPRALLRFAGHDVAAIARVEDVVAKIRPLVPGLVVAPGVSNGMSADALRASWGAALVEDPAVIAPPHRAWHRDRPEIVVWHHRSVFAIDAWSRAHVMRVRYAWAPGVEPERVHAQLLRDGAVVLATAGPSLEPSGASPAAGFSVRAAPPRGSEELGPLAPGRYTLLVAPIEPRSRVAPVTLDVATGDFDAVVPLDYAR